MMPPYVIRLFIREKCDSCPVVVVVESLRDKNQKSLSTVFRKGFYNFCSGLPQDKRIEESARIVCYFLCRMFVRNAVKLLIENLEKNVFNS